MERAILVSVSPRRTRWIAAGESPFPEPGELPPNASPGIASRRGTSPVAVSLLDRSRFMSRFGKFRIDMSPFDMSRLVMSPFEVSRFGISRFGISPEVTSG